MHMQLEMHITIQYIIMKTVSDTPMVTLLQARKSTLYNQDCKYDFTIVLCIYIH